MLLVVRTATIVLQSSCCQYTQRVIKTHYIVIIQVWYHLLILKSVYIIQRYIRHCNIMSSKGNDNRLSKITEHNHQYSRNSNTQSLLAHTNIPDSIFPPILISISISRLYLKQPNAVDYQSQVEFSVEWDYNIQQITEDSIFTISNVYFLSPGPPKRTAP